MLAKPGFGAESAPEAAPPPYRAVFWRRRRYTRKCERISLKMKKSLEGLNV